MSDIILPQINFSFTGPYETLHKLTHELGLYSNIVVSATYEHHGIAELTPSLLFKALPKVIQEHPALALIADCQPSLKTKGHHRSWEARLKRTHLKGCVEFVDGYAYEKRGLQQILEEEHNKWFKN
jgi:hypothetical protein